MNDPQQMGRTDVGVVDLLDQFEDVSRFLDRLVRLAGWRLRELKRAG